MATYACSDIHGLKRNYDAMMKDLHEEDTLYVLGDVIDRGEDGILILQDLLARDNVIIMMGNHEYMMLQYYDEKKELEDDRVGHHFTCSNWFFNHNASTMRQFEALSNDEQLQMLEQIRKFPIAICDVRVHDFTYYLVHGCPSRSLTKGIITLQDLPQHHVGAEHLLWNRIDPKMTYMEDRCVITGHTPTLFFQDNKPYEIWYQGDDIQTSTLMDIDCGCAAQNEHSQIGCICLEDRMVHYY